MSGVGNSGVLDIGSLSRRFMQFNNFRRKVQRYGAIQ